MKICTNTEIFSKISKRVVYSNIGLTTTVLWSFLVGAFVKTFFLFLAVFSLFCFSSRRTQTRQNFCWVCWVQLNEFLRNASKLFQRVPVSFLVGAFSLKEKSPTLTVSSFFFSWQSHSEWSTFLTIFVHLSYLFIFQFSVCRKRWMSLNGLFLSFSALCDLKNTFFRKKNQNFFFEKKFFSKFFQ